MKQPSYVDFDEKSYQWKKGINYKKNHIDATAINWTFKYLDKNKYTSRAS